MDASVGGHQRGAGSRHPALYGSTARPDRRVDRPGDRQPRAGRDLVRTGLGRVRRQPAACRAPACVTCRVRRSGRAGLERPRGRRLAARDRVRLRLPRHVLPCRLPDHRGLAGLRAGRGGGRQPGRHRDVRQRMRRGLRSDPALDGGAAENVRRSHGRGGRSGVEPADAPPQRPADGGLRLRGHPVSNAAHEGRAAGTAEDRDRHARASREAAPGRPRTRRQDLRQLSLSRAGLAVRSACARRWHGERGADADRAGRGNGRRLRAALQGGIRLGRHVGRRVLQRRDGLCPVASGPERRRIRGGRRHGQLRPAGPARAGVEEAIAGKVAELVARAGGKK